MQRLFVYAIVRFWFVVSTFSVWAGCPWIIPEWDEKIQWFSGRTVILVCATINGREKVEPSAVIAAF